jgi:hypothetical protein
VRLRVPTPVQKKKKKKPQETKNKNTSTQTTCPFSNCSKVTETGRKYSFFFFVGHLRNGA